MERVNQVALHVAKLGYATGVIPENKADSSTAMPDGVTSDLDIEALTKGLLEAARDLDQFLVGLLTAEDSDKQVVKKEIEAFENDLRVKQKLFEETRTALQAAQKKLQELEDEQARVIYHA